VSAGPSMLGDEAATRAVHDGEARRVLHLE
jgi:hypothetical protein